MPLIGTKMPNYTFLARFKPQIQSSWAQKPPKRDHIYKFCLYIRT